MSDNTKPRNSGVTNPGTEPFNDHDPVHSYLVGIGRTPLVSQEQEQELGAQIADGLAAERLYKAERTAQALPSPAVCRAYERRMAIGLKAQDHLTKANLRLVVHIARRYRRYDYDLLDRIQDGNMGLMRAVVKFDHTRGFKFSTYATWWIRKAISRGIESGAPTVRLPSHVHILHNQVKTEKNRLESMGQKLPSDDILCKNLGVTQSRLRDVLDIPTVVPLEYNGGTRDIQDDFDMSWTEAAHPGDQNPKPDELAAKSDSDRRLFAAMNDLGTIQKLFLMYRYGIDGTPRTIREAADLVGITVPAAVTLERNAIIALRSSSWGRRYHYEHTLQSDPPDDWDNPTESYRSVIC